MRQKKTRKCDIQKQKSKENRTDRVRKRRQVSPPVISHISNGDETLSERRTYSSCSNNVTSLRTMRRKLSGPTNDPYLMSSKARQKKLRDSQMIVTDNEDAE